MFYDFSELKARVDLIVYIEARTGIKFKRVGSDNRANRCPFCGSKTGFSVSDKHPDKWHCFACGKSGDVIEFEKEYSNCTIQEAAAIVAGHASVVVPSEKPRKRKGTDQKKKKPLYQYLWETSSKIAKKSLQTWLETESRNFGVWADKAIDLIVDRVKLNDYQGQSSIVLPVISYQTGKMVGVQTIGIEDSQKKFHGTNKGVFVFDTGSKEIVFVESFANALSLACVGYTAIVIFTTSNVKDIQAIVSRIKTRDEKEFYIWLDKDRDGDDKVARLQIEALREYPKLKGVWFREDKPEKYDVNDLLQDEQENFSQAVREHLAKAQSFTNLQRIEAKRELKSVEIREVLRTVREREILFLVGATGIGKTHEVLLDIIENYKRGEPSTLFCSTITEVDRAIDKLKSLLPEKCHKDISRAVSGNSGCGEEIDISDMETIGLIAVTTYAYLGPKGELPALYGIAKKLTEGRNLYGDEFPELYRRTLILYPLVARYLLRRGGSDRGTYRLFHKCPYSGKKGDCSECFLGYLKEAPNVNNERNFYRSVSERAFSEHNKPPVFPLFLPWATIMSFQKYERIISTLFYQPLDITPEYNLNAFENPVPGEERKSYSEYIKALVTHLYNPHLRVELPLFCKAETDENEQIKEEEIISPEAIAYLTEEEQQQVKYPVGACQTPFLCGVCLVHYLQLLRGRKLVLMSATPSSQMEQIVGEIATKEKWSTRKVEIHEVPFKFNICILKTSLRLSPEKQVRLVNALRKRLPKERMFVVTSIKQEAQAVYKGLKATLKDEAELFWREDFVSMVEERVYINRTCIKVIIVTYGGSAITKGVDLPTITICIIDVNQFLPQIAIPNINIRMTREQLRQAGLEHIADKIIQAIGRLLRSLKKRIAGVTQIDERQIVILLHGLPKELMSFILDARVLNEYREYRETFVSAIPRYVVESICDAIAACKAGGAPVDRREIDRRIVIEKAQEKGIEALSHIERSLLTEEDRIEMERRRQTGLEQKVIEAAQRGMTWREVCRQYTINRLSKREQSRLKKIFVQHITQ